MPKFPFDLESRLKVNNDRAILGSLRRLRQRPEVEAGFRSLIEHIGTRLAFFADGDELALDTVSHVHVLTNTALRLSPVVEGAEASSDGLPYEASFGGDSPLSPESYLKLPESDRLIIATLAFQSLGYLFSSALGSDAAKAFHPIEGESASVTRATLTHWIGLLRPAVTHANAKASSDVAYSLLEALEALEAGQAKGPFEPAPRIGKETNSVEQAIVRYRIVLMRDALKGYGWTGQRINGLMRPFGIFPDRVRKWPAICETILSPELRASIRNRLDAPVPGWGDEETPEDDDRDLEAFFKALLKDHQRLSPNYKDEGENQNLDGKAG